MSLIFYLGHYVTCCILIVIECGCAIFVQYLIFSYLCHMVCVILFLFLAIIEVPVGKIFF